MTNTVSTAESSPNAAAAMPATSMAQEKKSILKEIGAKWNRFSEQDLSGLKGKEDLVNQIVTKYSAEKEQTQRDVDGFLKGRQF